MGCLTVTADAATVAAVMDRLDATARARRGGGDPRTLDQLRCDLATEPCSTATSTRRRRQADAPGTAVSGAVERDAVSSEAAAMVWLVVPFEVATGASDTACELPGHGWVTAAHAREVMTRPGSVWATLPVDVRTGQAITRPTRAYRPTTAMVEHVRAVDGVCRGPGCEVLATRCDLDHETPWPHRRRPPSTTSTRSTGCTTTSRPTASGPPNPSPTTASSGPPSPAAPTPPTPRTGAKDSTRRTGWTRHRSEKRADARSPEATVAACPWPRSLGRPTNPNWRVGSRREHECRLRPVPDQRGPRGPQGGRPRGRRGQDRPVCRRRRRGGALPPGGARRPRRVRLLRTARARGVRRRGGRRLGDLHRHRGGRPRRRVGLAHPGGQQARLAPAHPRRQRRREGPVPPAARQGGDDLLLRAVRA